MALPAKKLSNHEFFLGVNTSTANPLFLNAGWVETGIHIIGPPGVGKSMLLFWLFQLCTKIRNATIVLLDPKGDLFFLARDWAISHGLTSRLDVFDLADPDYFMQYSNLTPNGLPAANHTKFAREGFRSSWGAQSFDQTPQLARLLYLSLFVTRTLGWTLIQAVQLLWPGSPVRKQALAQLPPSYVRDALAYFDSLSERRQEELSASTLARLEPFVSDPQIQRVICPADTHSFEVDRLIKQHGILLGNFQHYAPLFPDDARLFSRLLLSDVLAHGFSRPRHARDPIIVIGDEVQEFATRDLCAALDRGRGLGVYSILAHQHAAQVQEEDKTGYLFSSLLNSARTKIVFGGNSVHDLEEYFVKELLIDQYSPWMVKDELTSLEQEAVEETRESVTHSTMHSRGRGLAFPSSVARGESDTLTAGYTRSESQGVQDSTSQAFTKGTSKGTSIARGMSQTHSDTWSETHTDAEHWAETDSEGETFSEGSHQSFGGGASGGRDFGYTWDPEGNWTTSFNTHQGWNTQRTAGSDSSRGRSRSSSHTQGGSTSDAVTTGGADARTISASVGEQYGESESTTVGRTAGMSREQGRAISATRGRTTSTTTSRGVTPSISAEERVGSSTTTAPFHAFRKRRVVSSRTFLTKEEFLTLGLQKIKAQPTGHFLIKVPTRPAVFVRAPVIKEPRITAAQLTRARERIFARPYYTRITDIPVEGEVLQDVSYQEKQLVNSHANRSTPRTPRKPRRPKTTPTS